MGTGFVRVSRANIKHDHVSITWIFWIGRFHHFILHFITPWALRNVGTDLETVKTKTSDIPEDTTRCMVTFCVLRAEKQHIPRSQEHFSISQLKVIRPFFFVPTVKRVFNEKKRLTQIINVKSRVRSPGVHTRLKSNQFGSFVWRRDYLNAKNSFLIE